MLLHQVLIAKDSEDLPETNQRRDRAHDMHALKGLAQPDDIGGVVAFLASDDA
jgi:3-oxoacyl-[acyl-carrier protein] reductase